MGVNKVEFEDNTLIDLTQDSVTPQNLLSGATAHNKAGERIQGSVVIPEVIDSLSSTRTDAALSANQGKVLDGKAFDALTAAKKAYSVATGKNRARVFSTTADMYSWLSSEANKATASIGDNLYIVELDVPDWWISKVLAVPNESGLYYEISQLETQKVDLTTIEAAIQKNADDISTLNSNLENFEVITIPSSYANIKIYKQANVKIINIATFENHSALNVKDITLIGSITNKDYIPQNTYKEISHGIKGNTETTINENGEIIIYSYSAQHPAVELNMVYF